MKCSKCNGMVYLDRVFSDNLNYETSCLICGKREFISKESKLGQWIKQREQVRRRLGDLSE